MKRQLLRHAAMIGALVMGAAGSAAAQDGPGEFATWSTPGWSFTPGVAIGGLWDSNVALAAAPADARGTQADTLFVVEPTAQLGYLSPRTEFTSGYRGYIRRYVDLDQLNGFDQRGYLSLRRLATRRLTYFLTNEYAQVPTTDQVALNGVPFSRTGARTNGLSGGVEARLSKATDLSVRYENTWVKFDRQDLSDTVLNDGWVNGVRSELSHHLTGSVAFGAEYGVRLADLNQGTRQLAFQDAGGTMHVKRGAHTKFDVAGGLAYLDDRTFGITHTGPYVRAELTHDAEKATVGASFEHTFVPSFGFGASNRNQEVRGFIRMPLDRNRMYVQGMAAWRRSDPLVASDLQLDTVWIRSTVGYATARWLRLEGYYAFSRQDTRIAGGGIDRHVAGTQIVISQPMRIQ